METITYKHSFKSDYGELAHPKVLSALSAVGNTQFEGYGLDEYSLRAADLIKEKIMKPSADVHFISGGTQANMVVISSALRPYEAVIAPISGHIYMHEAGAIEATGHKVCNVKTGDGKLRAADIEEIVTAHYDEHMVVPRIVYISQSVENGAVYKKAELSELSGCCRKNGLFLFVDGARLGTALNSPACDLTYADIAELADVFYIGGTKNGALFGEAIVICADKLKENFRYQIKQRGAMLAKGAAIGVQFEALFKDGLYDELAAHANAMAFKMADGIKKAGYGFRYPVETNQIFPEFPESAAQKLHSLYDFYDWETSGDAVTVRLASSWATTESVIEEFIADLL
ncbi:MAG: aminotransferase class I/II-fold pyridoxal phosphate-dependent enzyme [Oscillospiraceae bacterium]|jgi:threonine aldolase|nr:aminotransferase class I/II-fold pyridoxal phosphate-dependent enzyme [Oscillospiraceae bacterium]